MKNTLRIAATLLLLCLIGGAFAACTKTLSGTYRTDEVLGSYTELKFSGSKVTINVYAVGTLASGTECTYELKDTSIVITVPDGESAALSGELAFSENDDGCLKIGVLTFHTA